MTQEEMTPLVEGRITLKTKFAYSLGHVFNDLAAAMWFSYTLIYLQRIALLEPISAGALLLLGQLVDALMTPVFGVLMDRYSKKKTWHIIGSVLVALSFPVIFGNFFESLAGLSMAIYILSITIFQTGWAAVQISHLSMIPMLTHSPLIRADLTAIRYSAQVSAAVFVFLVTWIVLPTNDESMAKLSKQDGYKFRDIVVVITTFGIAATVLFHAFLKAKLLEIVPVASQKSDSEAPQRNEAESNRRPRIGVTLLLGVALLYVASRLFITLATVYLPLYIEETDVGGKQALATVPLVSYLASFAAALTLKYINRSCGTKICYLLGALIGILGAAVAEYAGRYEFIVYAVATLIGAASSITMVTALSVTAEIIGPRTENSALVYSIVTFLDKVVTGLVVVLIEHWRCDDKELCPNYNRDTLSAVCAGSMLLGFVTLMSVGRCLSP
ncbi:major facilitator superfamily domain-containing protein 12 [Fopius arisanus]|uniref:Major facilitator superfamily domain-containing protein 12 n=2 Tax=Fopius arisanus TaxID=64838 RepID=A0A9R1TY53_9HYME|nr:PREDICTED: major facilitator superfamily domain-containing protein 12-like [Fopius arisanus]XP_011300653.1 PREDICTED: major facilitator superfamily domain-containing protein 12-like [Fopius arisanus]XP_011300654.1 PREDICTED: major facilitator superfamily domain-containing protein 12-like [Fopius arisanus]XP_011300655.1 PREDICTED: major facilitator superfamily domain-containing protein 12-like [Fopius arisanus]XP_011300656.1 PREDICTED: major facilitator superfamily domain-containing protein 1